MKSQGSLWPAASRRRECQRGPVISTGWARGGCSEGVEEHREIADRLEKLTAYGVKLEVYLSNGNGRFTLSVKGKRVRFVGRLSIPWFLGIVGGRGGAGWRLGATGFHLCRGIAAITCSNASSISLAALRRRGASKVRNSSVLSHRGPFRSNAPPGMSAG